MARPALSSSSPDSSSTVARVTSRSRSLLVAQRLAERAELAGADGGSDDGAQRVPLSLLDALGEFDLALAREERHASELLEVGGDRVGRRVARCGGTGGLDGKGRLSLSADGGVRGNLAVRSMPKRAAGLECFHVPWRQGDLDRGRIRRVCARQPGGVRRRFGPPEHLSVKEAFFQGTEVVDHQNPLQVVVFMLDCDGQQPLGLELEPSPVAGLAP